MDQHILPPFGQSGEQSLPIRKPVLIVEPMEAAGVQYEIIFVRGLELRHVCSHEIDLHSGPLGALDAERQCLGDKVQCGYAQVVLCQSILDSSLARRYVIL